MWDEIFKLAVSNGIWAVMFCMLLVYQLKDSRTREHKYHDIINNLTEKLKTVNLIADSVEQIKKEMQKKNKKTVQQATQALTGEIS